MRFADGPTVEVEVRIAAPPERVWPLVSDISVPARFSGELQEASWAPGSEGPVLGARFLGRSEHPVIGTWQTTSTITACDAPIRFAWEVEGGGGAAAAWRFDLEPDGEGTVLRQWARLGPGQSGITPAIKARPDKEEAIVARRLSEWQANMQLTVEGIRDLAESEG